MAICLGFLLLSSWIGLFCTFIIMNLSSFDIKVKLISQRVEKYFFLFLFTIKDFVKRDANFYGLHSCYFFLNVVILYYFSILYDPSDTWENVFLHLFFQFSAIQNDVLRRNQLKRKLSIWYIFMMYVFTFIPCLRKNCFVYKYRKIWSIKKPYPVQ